MNKRYKIDYKFNNFSNSKPKNEEVVKKKTKNAPSVKKRLLKQKKTSSLLICGTSDSIVNNRSKFLSYISKYDSIGMDWFCKSGIKTDFYFVRDQAHHSSMISFKNGETIAGFVDDINNYYLDSTLLISKLDQNEYDDYGTRWNWGKNPKRFKSKTYVFQEKSSNKYIDLKKDFTKKCYRYSYDFFSILQFAVMMEYKSVILVGFELNNNKCFWYNGLRDIHHKRGLELDDIPEEYYAYRDMLNFYKNNFRKEVFTIDEGSRLLEGNLAIYLK